jgi:hypothetical protein
MKTLFSKTGSLPLLLLLATVAVWVTAFAQQLDVPPVSMGLWQTETTSTVTGIENTPMAGMAASLGRSHVTQSCLTPESWKSDIQGFNAKQQHGCTLTNMHQDPHEVSFDEACGPGGSTSSHVDILIDSTEHAHGTVVMKVTAPSLPQPMTINMSMVSHYLGSACGDVMPREGKMIK